VSFLLDTNVVSEWVKPQANAGLIAWLDGVDEDRVFLSVVTLTELRYGIERLAAGKRRRRLEHWLTRELPVRFEGRVLMVDATVAHTCGELMARREAAGRPLHTMDAFLAATAAVHGLTVVTRNDSDFQGTVPSVNPWN